MQLYKPLAFCLAAFSLFCSPPVFSAEFVTVAKDGANVRTGPGTGNPVRMELFEGYPLKVLKKEKGWLQVTDFENDTGWIEGSLTRTGDTVILKAQKTVGLRLEPNTGSRVVANLEKGVVLKKVGMKDQWLHVRHSSGVSGWIQQSFVWP